MVKSVLAPVGHFTGQIGRPAGQALLDVEKQAKEEVGYTKEEVPQGERPGGKGIGGNKQTGNNPLGL